MSSKNRVSTYITVTYDSGTDGDLSPHVLFHIPDTGIPCGQVMPMYLIAANESYLDGYVLFYEQESMGPGTRVVMPNEVTEEVLSFAEQDLFQLEFPIASIVSITGRFIKGIFNTSNELIDTAMYEGDFIKLGGSAVGPETRDKLYGDGTIEYYPGRYRTRWNWTVDCSREKHWFFLKKNGIIVRKFEITVDMDQIIAATGERAVVIRIIEFSSQEPVAGALVRVANRNLGYTDEYGEVETVLDVGTYSLRITKQGFVPSDEDDISNDAIEVR
jgi:hypothetical protein